MGYLKLISGGSAIGVLVALFLGLSMRLNEQDKLLVPAIFGCIGLVCGSILSAIAGATEKSALEGSAMARFVYFGILGMLGGTLLGIPLATTMDAGTGGDTALARAVVILLLMLLIAGIAASVGVLTRKSKPRESFAEPTKPTATIVGTIVLVLIGNARRAMALFSPASQGVEAVLVVSIIAWFLIAYVIIRFSINKYRRKLAVYEAWKSKAQSLGDATSEP